MLAPEPTGLSKAIAVGEGGVAANVHVDRWNNLINGSSATPEPPAVQAGVQQAASAAGASAQTAEYLGKAANATVNVFALAGLVRQLWRVFGAEAAGATKAAEAAGAAKCPVHSRYPDGTLVYEGQQPSKITGPSTEAQGTPHTVLQPYKNGRIYKAREYGEGKVPKKDIDFTTPTYPNGTPRPNHNAPEQHPWIPNDPGNPSAGYKRGPGEPLQ